MDTHSRVGSFTVAYSAKCLTTLRLESGKYRMTHLLVVAETGEYLKCRYERVDD